jgi:UDP-glucose 4-epimerase
MNILVTGGLGFVGSNLVDELVSAGHFVTVIDNLSSHSSSEKYKNKYVKYYIDDIRNIDKYALPEIEVIFHLAGLARIQPSFDSPLEYVDVNVNGTAKVCELARNLNARLVYSSSSSINNGEYKTPYTFSKWGGEEVLKTWIECYSIDAVICRFYNVYGPREPKDGDYATVVKKFITKYNNNEPLTIVGTGEQRRDFTHIDDIVTGLIKAMEDGISGSLYHLGRGVNYSINDLTKMFPDAIINHVPERRGEGDVTLADYQDTFNRLGWDAKINLTDYIKEVI